MPLLEGSRDAGTMDHFQHKALDLLTSSRARAALDLSREPEALKERYGPTLYGTSLLAARRLVEAGVTLVTVTTESRGAGHWDSHSNNFGMLKSFHLPNLDQIATALFEDLDDRGLLDSTLVAIMGEMGRTPRINKNAGRDHWPQCGFAFFFGGGVQEGLVLGSTDKLAAYPLDHPGHAGRHRRHDLPPAGCRSRADASRPHRPPDRHRSRGRADRGDLGVMLGERDNPNYGGFESHSPSASPPIHCTLLTECP